MLQKTPHVGTGSPIGPLLQPEPSVVTCVLLKSSETN